MLFLNYMLAAGELVARTSPYIGYPMMTTAGLKTYDGLTKKYPWLKITTAEVRTASTSSRRIAKTLQLWNTAWSKIKA